MNEEPARFGVSEFTHWFQTFEEDVSLYTRMDVDGLELCERKLSEDPTRAREQLAFLRDTGLPISSIQPRVHALFPDFMCPELVNSAERMAKYRETIDLMSQYFRMAPLVTITGKAPQSNYQLAHQIARKSYAELADYAAERGMRIMLEPLHPIFMNTDTFICSFRDAMKLVHAVNRENFGILLDVCHVWWEPLIQEQILAAGDRIFGVHISDWPSDEPRCPADRLLPGDGCIDLPALLGAIDKAGYRGVYCLEIFSDASLPDSLWRQDGALVIDRARRGFNQAWKNRHD